MRSKYPQIRRPAVTPQPPRYILRTELDDGTVDEVGTGHALEEERDAAKSYASRTGRKVWIIDRKQDRTVFRLEGAKALAGGAR
jgi:hypothetical protein